MWSFNRKQNLQPSTEYSCHLCQVRLPPQWHLMNKRTDHKSKGIQTKPKNQINSYNYTIYGKKSFYVDYCNIMSRVFSITQNSDRLQWLYLHFLSFTLLTQVDNITLT
ncbi:hypothetical protein Hdeb2414_s0002g00052741 [Helianthus debilis subsp. tardiflorus]